jgi:hypothetical protein
VRDRADRDVEDIQILAPDEVEQQIQRPLEGLQDNFKGIRWDVEIARQFGQRLAADQREGHLGLGRLRRCRVGHRLGCRLAHTGFRDEFTAARGP